MSDVISLSERRAAAAARDGTRAALGTGIHRPPATSRRRRNASTPALVVTVLAVFSTTWAAGSLPAAAIAALIVIAGSVRVYRGAYEDGFLGGYHTAVDDCDDLGPCYERLER